MLLREIGVELHALGGQLRDLRQRQLQVAIDFGPEACGLLDRGIFRKDEKRGARRGAVLHPDSNLLLPFGKRIRLTDGILRTRDFQCLRLLRQSVFIQNCMSWRVSSGWSTSFQS